MKTYSKKEDGGILMHSDTYLGEDYVSANLVHYKYLRKEVRNGHTYYIYDDSESKMGDKISEKANKVLKKGYWDGNTHTSSYYNKDGSRVTLSTSIGGSSRKNTEKDIRDQKNYKRAESFIKKHAKQKLKDIPKKIASRGVAFVSKIIRFFRGD